jgi:hypothetical protein
MTDIDNFIDTVLNQDFSKAGPMFNELLGSKINDALEQEKISVAASMFGDEDKEQLEMEFDEDEDDFDITDEDEDEAIDELEDEDEDE